MYLVAEVDFSRLNDAIIEQVQFEHKSILPYTANKMHVAL